SQVLVDHAELRQARLRAPGTGLPPAEELGAQPPRHETVRLLDRLPDMRRRERAEARHPGQGHDQEATLPLPGLRLVVCGGGCMKINVDMLGHAYDYLSCTDPFRGWNLPPSEEIMFKLFRKWKKYAHYFRVDGVHHIELSSRLVTSNYMLMSTMAHEMVHLFL